MKRLFKHQLILLVFTLILTHNSYGAEPIQPSSSNGASSEIRNREIAAASQKAKSENSSWISDGKNLKGKWWLRNPKKYDPLPNPLLYHIETAYAFSELGGNVEAKYHKGDIDLTLQKDLWTSLTSYTIGKNDVTQVLKDKNTNMNNQMFRQGLRYALTDRLSAAGGFIWETNDTKYLATRLVYYGGVRYMVIDTPKYNLMVGGFYSFVDTSYQNGNIWSVAQYKDFPAVDDYTSDAIYMSERFEWNITDTLSFTQSTDYMQLLKNSDYSFFKLRGAMNYKLSQRTSFFTAYTVNYDNNPFVESVQDYLEVREASGKFAGTMETVDTILEVGIKFEF